MTALRSLAVKISRCVVRWASPGCREWAEGLEREVAAIESDWAALRWAISGLRVALDRRKAPIASLAEVPAEAQRLVEQMRSGYNYWYVILQGPGYVVKFFVDGNASFYRAGCALVAIASFVAATSWLIDRHRLKAPSKDDVYDDPLACALFYRTVLKRNLFRLGINAFAGSSFAAGMILAQKGSVRDHLFFSVLLGLACILLPLILFWGRRNIERKIEDLDALLDRTAE